jgi:histidinol-phosphate/aromatic aminotransferase/cobyric acid decarboxylase-like protein
VLRAVKAAQAASADAAEQKTTLTMLKADLEAAKQHAQKAAGASKAAEVHAPFILGMGSPLIHLVSSHLHI